MFRNSLQIHFYNFKPCLAVSLGPASTFLALPFWVGLLDDFLLFR